MTVAFLATRIQAQVLQLRRELDSTYERLPDAYYFWGRIDLVESSNFRLRRGPREGYVRGETFLSLVAETVSPCASVRIIKEIGDEVLLASSELRPVLEAMLIVDYVARQMSGVVGETAYPFAVRCGIDYGPAKRLMRPQEDFLGAPIDRLSRIMSVRSSEANVLISEDAFGPSKAIVKEYEPAVSVGPPETLSAEQSKGMAEPVVFRGVGVDPGVLAEVDELFVSWR